MGPLSGRYVVMWSGGKDSALALTRAREYTARGGRAVITCCELAKLDGAWLEYHSFAFAGPPFTGTVGWVAGPRHLESGFLQLELLSLGDAVLATARETVAADEALAAAVRARQAGAWGRLAGLAVIAHRARLGRRLEDPERRAVWDAVWREAHGTTDERYHRPTTS